MTKEVGTLREIGARVGDMVDTSGYGAMIVQNGRDRLGHDGLWAESKSGCEWLHGNYTGFRIISRATKPFNTLTAEEKGELLLANHEGKIIEMSLDGGDTWERSYTPQWIGAACYRVKGDDVKDYILNGNLEDAWSRETLPGDTHRITFNLVNGKPDCASVKMEEL